MNNLRHSDGPALVYLGDIFRHLCGLRDSGIIPPHRTIRQISGMIGLSVATTYAALQLLENTGAIECLHGEYGAPNLYRAFQPEIKKFVSPGADNLLDEQEAANFLSINVRTLQAWRSTRPPKNGSPPFAKIGRLVRYRRSDLLAWVEKQERWTTKGASDGH
jgi:predicted DNA-binding transcriptional regulator AlpA